MAAAILLPLADAEAIDDADASSWSSFDAVPLPHFAKKICIRSFIFSLLCVFTTMQRQTIWRNWRTGTAIVSGPFSILDDAPDNHNKQPVINIAQITKLTFSMHRTSPMLMRFAYVLSCKNARFCNTSRAFRLICFSCNAICLCAVLQECAFL